MATPGLNLQITEPELKLLQTLVYQECGMFFDERRFSLRAALDIFELLKSELTRTMRPVEGSRPALVHQI